MKKYCPNCRKKEEMTLKSLKEIYNVLGEDIEVSTKAYVCKKCKTSVFDEIYDSQNILLAYEKYKEKHNLLSSNEIKDIRHKYGLSQRSFSNLLGWGEKTLCRYENGAIQDNVHNDLLKMLQNKKNMIEYLKNNKNRISEKEYNTIVSKVNIDDNVSTYKELIETIQSEPSIFNGFKSFDYVKFHSMVQFFADKQKGIKKTKLMKLLNYSDYLFFKENCISISGASYYHYPYGPVPSFHDELLSIMSNDGLISISYEKEIDFESTIIHSKNKDYMNNLNEDEIRTMNRIYRKFKTLNSKEISDISHKEKGYINTKPYELISYDYSLDMEI